MKITYNGGSLALDIRLPDRWLHVMRGETVQVSDDEADRLLTMEGWQLADPDATATDSLEETS